jgi:hypothetical protein
MELVEELKDTKTIVWVLTGNGPTEFKALKGTARKYDGGKKVLYFPRRPGYHHGSGLSVLKVIKIYVDKYKVKNFFFLVDREHIEMEAKVDDKLKEFGIEVNNVQKFSANEEEALYIEGTIGVHDFDLWVAVIGREKCIEEDIAHLIQTKFGEKVEPSKEGVKSALKKHSIDVEQLMARASIEKIKHSFPALHMVLSHLETAEQ